MRDPKPIAGGRALLFERLSEEDPHSPREEARPHRAHDEEALRASVRRELSLLLNTRRHTNLFREAGGEEATVLDYGVPDFSSLSASSSEDQRLLAETIKGAVAAFEPRLQGVSVRVERLRQEDRALLLRVEARLVIGTVAEPVSFPLLLRGKLGRTEVCEDERA